MKLLITGANGLLGQKLIAETRGDESLEVVASGRGDDRNPIGTHAYQAMDITNKAQVQAVFELVKPDVVINTAAMTQVDQCESDREACWDQNVTAVSHLIEACEEHGSHLVHLSTDFIFDGLDGPYDEDGIPNPVSYYGESKLAAEKLLTDSSISWSIIRTVLVYGIVPNLSRSNIILWVKKSLEEGRDIKVVNDQWRTPTLAEDLAIGCLLAAKQKAQGVFNISGKDMLSPYDMAVETARFFDLDMATMEETDGSVFKQAAKRPPKTGFILTKAREQLGYEPRSFREGLAILQEQLASANN